jgi:hypothetical protein
MGWGCEFDFRLPISTLLSQAENEQPRTVARRRKNGKNEFNRRKQRSSGNSIKLKRR